MVFIFGHTDNAWYSVSTYVSSKIESSKAFIEQTLEHCSGTLVQHKPGLRNDYIVALQPSTWYTDPTLCTPETSSLTWS